MQRSRAAAVEISQMKVTTKVMPPLKEDTIQRGRNQNWIREKDGIVSQLMSLSLPAVHPVLIQNPMKCQRIYGTDVAAHPAIIVGKTRNHPWKKTEERIVRTMMTGRLTETYIHEESVVTQAIAKKATENDVTPVISDIVVVLKTEIVGAQRMTDEIGADQGIDIISTVNNQDNNIIHMHFKLSNANYCEHKCMHESIRVIINFQKPVITIHFKFKGVLV